MKKINAIIATIVVCMCFQSCRKELVDEQTLEEYVLNRLQKECGDYSSLTIENVYHVWEFKDTEFVVSYWREGYDDPSTGLYLKYHEGEAFSQQFTGLINRCGLNTGNFQVGEKYKISGYGIVYEGPGPGIPEYRGFPLIIDSIEKIE